MKTIEKRFFYRNERLQSHGTDFTLQVDLCQIKVGRYSRGPCFWE